MNSPSDQVLVKIECSQRVRYSQLVKMPRDEWEKLKATDERTMEREQLSPLTSWLDFRDVYDSGDFDDIEIDVVNEEGANVEPADYWNPE